MICQHCQSEFAPKMSKQKYCSKTCNVSAWVAAHRERSNEIKRKYILSHPDKRSESIRRYNTTHPEVRAELKRRHNAAYPKQHSAQNSVNRAVRHGKLTRPTICSQCGITGEIQAHHHLGYALEHYLDVIWLCPKCHSSADQEMRYDLAAAA
jgi:hypothetical protein